jgi:hypothetical protein
VPDRKVSPKVLLALIGLGGWLVALAAGRLGGPALLFWLALAAGAGCLIVAGLWAVQGGMTQPAEPKPYLDIRSVDVTHAAIRDFRRPGFPETLIDPPTSAASYSTGETRLEYSGGTVPSLDYAPDPDAPIVELQYETPCFARVMVTNDPRELPGMTAEKVVASISFYDEEGNPLLDGPIQGRWSASKQPHERDRIGVSLDHLEAEISPNGLPHPLDIAMKHPSDPDCFAYNDDNSSAYQGRLESHRLSGDSFRVDVTVRAGNSGEPLTRLFTLTNPGVGRDLEIAPD